MSEHRLAAAPTQDVPGKRNYGIDLLRIIAMFYVIVLHSLGMGGVLQASNPGSAQYAVAWFMELSAFCAVNIFALISGYVCYSEREKKTNYSNYLMIWLQVVTWGAAVTLLCMLFFPARASKKDLLTVLLPVTNGLYWYFTAYSALVVVMPLLNAGIRRCSVHTLKKLFVVLFFVFSTFEVVTNRFWMALGNSFLWIAILYVMGAIIKKCGIGSNAKPLPLLLGIVLMTLISWLWKLYGPEFTFLNVTVTRDLFVSYTSPTALLSAIFYFLLFSRLRPGKAAEKVIAFAAPAAFAAYILNNQMHIWKYGMSHRFDFLAARSPAVIAAVVLGFSFCFLCVSILLDRIRIALFDLLHVRKAADRVVNTVHRFVQRIADRL